MQGRGAARRAKLGAGEEDGVGVAHGAARAPERQTPGDRIAVRTERSTAGVWRRLYARWVGEDRLTVLVAGTGGRLVSIAAENVPTPRTANVLSRFIFLSLYSS